MKGEHQERGAVVNHILNESLDVAEANEMGSPVFNQDFPHALAVLWLQGRKLAEKQKI